MPPAPRLRYTSSPVSHRSMEDGIGELKLERSRNWELDMELSTSVLQNDVLLSWRHPHTSATAKHLTSLGRLGEDAVWNHHPGSCPESCQAAESSAMIASNSCWYLRTFKDDVTSLRSSQEKTSTIRNSKASLSKITRGLSSMQSATVPHFPELPSSAAE